MRTLDELGISPTPWRIHDDRVLCKSQTSPTYSVCQRGGFSGNDEWANTARLIKSAPTMYETLYRIVKMIDDPCICKAKTMEHLMSVELPRMKYVLAKAGGESEVAKAKEAVE